MRNTLEKDPTDNLDALTEDGLRQLGAETIVYVRSVKLEDLDRATRSLISLPEGTILYGVYTADGSPLAVVEDRDAAFAGARQYEYEPVSVH